MFNFDLKTILFRAIILVIAFTVHEYMHAYVAFRLGDTTARDAGRLTLNPLVHLDIFGSLMLLLVGFGWAKPVPVDPYALRRRTPAGLMLVSVAGPLSNLVLAILGGLIVRLFIAFRLSFIPPMWLLEFINQFIIVNIMLFCSISFQLRLWMVIRCLNTQFPIAGKRVFKNSDNMAPSF